MSQVTSLTGQEYLHKILLSRIYDVARVTPLQKLDKLSERLHCKVLLKREDYQQIHSFKIRGAYYKMKNLSPEQRGKGVIAASAGNHAQGCALSAAKLGCRAVIVMPKTTPDLKVDAVRRLGGEVVLWGESFNEAYDHAIELSQSEGLTLIPPYDDADVIAGQGTIAQELIGQCDDIDTIFVPVGGGGLAAGVAVYVKNLVPEIKVIGVEAEGSACMLAALKNHGPCDIGYVSHFADGVAVKLVGEETFALCRDLLDDIITVDTDAICGAIKDIFEDTRVVAEPAGALALAGLRAYARAGNLRDTTLVAVVSGANMNFDRLSHVAERARFGANREALLGVTIPEKAGSFRQLVQAISSRNITELCTRFADPVNAHVLVGIDIKNSDEVASVLEDLRAAGFSACDLTDNELAKLHLRHMVGGNAPQVHNERLIRFFFPERPGALLNFMDAMRVTYNFTLFQYRYHGADFGRVLLGVEVPEERREDFEEFLARVDRMGYPHVDETDNPAYKMFLGWHHDN